MQAECPQYASLHGLLAINNLPSFVMFRVMTLAYRPHRHDKMFHVEHISVLHGLKTASATAA